MITRETIKHDAITHETIKHDGGEIDLYDMELRPIAPGEADHTKLASFEKWGHVYIDVDKDGQPLAVTLIVNKKPCGSMAERLPDKQ